VHSLSPCYGLLTALELLNSVAGWCNTTQFFTKMVFFYMLVCSGASSLEKGVCRGKAAFDITFQHKTTFSLKTRNRLMNFAMLPKYYIDKFPPIYKIPPIYRQYLLINGVFGRTVARKFSIGSFAFLQGALDLCGGHDTLKIDQISTDL